MSDLTELLRAARKEAHRLALTSRSRELQEVITKLQEAGMWHDAHVEAEARRRPAPASAASLAVRHRRDDLEWGPPLRVG